MPFTRTTGQQLPVPLPPTPGDARRELRTMLTGSRWCRHIDGVVLAVHEAVANAEVHGGGVSRVSAAIEGGDLVVSVCDCGPGFEIPDASRAGTVPTDLMAEGGRGIWLICQLASRVETGRDGDNFCLRLRFEPPRG